MSVSGYFIILLGVLNLIGREYPWFLLLWVFNIIHVVFVFLSSKLKRINKNLIILSVIMFTGKLELKHLYIAHRSYIIINWYCYILKKISNWIPPRRIYIFSFQICIIVILDITISFWNDIVNITNWHVKNIWKIKEKCITIRF